MKVYALQAIFSAKKDKPYVLTVNSKKTTLPIFLIEYTEFFHKEVIFKIKNLFTDTITVDSECSFNFLDIQQELTLNYVRNNEYYNFINKEDLIITYGGILKYFNPTDDFEWSEYKFNEQFQGYSSDHNLNLLLNYIISRSRI